MPSRSAEALIRLLLGVLGLAAIILIFVVDEANPGWSPVTSVLISLPLAFFGIYGLFAAIELREKPHTRDLLRFRRLGKRRPLLHVGGAGSSTTIRRPSVAAYTQPTRFGLRTRSSWIGLAIGLVGSLAAWDGATSAFGHTEPYSDAGFVWILTLPLTLLLAVRSALRIAFASRAVVIDAAGVRLGTALGFAWPLLVPFEDVESIVVLEDEPAAEFLIFTTDERSYHIDGRQLEDAEALTSWLKSNAAASRAQFVQREAFADPGPSLSRPLDTPVGSTPPDEVVESARRDLLRRQIRIGVLLVASTALLIAAIWAYLAMRGENDRLYESGRLYSAEVLEVDYGIRGASDQLHVRFVADGRTYERIINSGWFRNFDRGLEGGRVQVLFDPQAEGIARLRDRRNYPQWLGIGGLVALLAVALSGAGVAHYRRMLRALERGTWQRVRISATGERNSPVLVRRSRDDSDQILGAMWGRKSASFDDHPAWMAVGESVVVILPDDSERVLGTSIGKRSPLRQPPEPTSDAI